MFDSDNVILKIKLKATYDFYRGKTVDIVRGGHYSLPSLFIRTSMLFEFVCLYFLDFPQPFIFFDFPITACALLTVSIWAASGNCSRQLFLICLLSRINTIKKQKHTLAHVERALLLCISSIRLAGEHIVLKKKNQIQIFWTSWSAISSHLKLQTLGPNSVYLLVKRLVRKQRQGQFNIAGVERFTWGIICNFWRAYSSGSLWNTQPLIMSVTVSPSDRLLAFPWRLPY